MVDIAKERINGISKVVVKHHANVEFEGIEPIIPHIVVRCDWHVSSRTGS